MKTRCDTCNGPFGLIRRKFLGYHFCCKSCEAAWMAKRERALADFKHWLYGAPTHEPG